MSLGGSKICVPVCVGASDLRDAAVRAINVSDMIELRLDCLDQTGREIVLRELEALRGRARTVILTLRPAEQGGKTDVGRQERISFWSSVTQIPGVLFDIEYDLLPDLAGISPDKIICSHHDFEGNADPDSLYKRMKTAPAGILKIAIQIKDAVDCLAIFRLLDRAQRDGRTLIAIGMGFPGVVTRILGPSRGSVLTYGSLEHEMRTAPGQLSAGELREVYRVDQIDLQTEILGVIGKPVSHSISPYVHNAAFAKAARNAVFIPFEVDDVDEFMRRMVHPSSREINWNARGFSVTAPHKAAVIKHLDGLDPAAKEIGAVNTIVIKDGALRGYNTDALAFFESLKAKAGQLKDVRCAVIGAGGAARAVVWALNRGGASICLFARDGMKAKPLADQFHCEIRDFAHADFKDFEVLINATPLGTRGELETETPVKAEQLRGVRLAYDLVYNPLETRFLREARIAGCETLGGLDMLVGQAIEQFKLWTGLEPDAGTMRDAAERALGMK
jgi:3-dehydroquinate dehydratase / shikimate dehydrogenase